jgi:hypothetical protein
MNCSVSNGNDQNVAILLNNAAISSIIRGGTNTISLVPSQVCDVVIFINTLNHFIFCEKK